MQGKSHLWCWRVAVMYQPAVSTRCKLTRSMDLQKVPSWLLGESVVVILLVINSNTFLMNFVGISFNPFLGLWSLGELFHFSFFLGGTGYDPPRWFDEPRLPEELDEWARDFGVYTSEDRRFSQNIRKFRTWKPVVDCPSGMTFLEQVYRQCDALGTSKWHAKRCKMMSLHCIILWVCLIKW